MKSTALWVGVILTGCSSGLFLAGCTSLGQESRSTPKISQAIDPVHEFGFDSDDNELSVGIEKLLTSRGFKIRILRSGVQPRYVLRVRSTDLDMCLPEGSRQMHFNVSAIDSETGERVLLIAGEYGCKDTITKRVDEWLPKVSPNSLPAAREIAPGVAVPSPSMSQGIGKMHDSDFDPAPTPSEVAEVKHIAEKGGLQAQFKLGWMYQNGQGVPQSGKEASAWYHKAAEHGYVEAQYELGAIYASGAGVAKNAKESVSWYRKAAEQGHVAAQRTLCAMNTTADTSGLDNLPNGYELDEPATASPITMRERTQWCIRAAAKGDALSQFNLGMNYASGLGIPKDPKEAVAWYRKAAVQGEAAAQYALGTRYFNGKGAPQNYEEAASWFRKAAEQGNPDAQASLGFMYADGQGVAENHVEAYKWFVLYAVNGDSAVAHKKMKEVKESMTREEIAEAQRRAAQWKGGGSNETAVNPSAPITTIAPPEQRHASDVDAPSFSLKPNPNNFAVVIGVEKYQKLPSAQFAEHDAATMRKYLLGMGYPERNIIYLNGENATRSRLSSYLDEWLPKNTNSDSTIFFYFSGHGAPNAETKEAYLMPWDGDAQFLKSTAYPLNQIYGSLNQLKAKKKIVVLDACFSGSGGRSVLAMGTRPLVPRVTTADGLGGVILFAAASEDEVTGTLEDQAHGVFTYYLLQGLGGKAQDASGSVTAKGLHRYLKPLVQDAARRQNREQTPFLGGVQQDVELGKFK